jgi:hypothetical protein
VGFNSGFKGLTNTLTITGEYAYANDFKIRLRALKYLNVWLPSASTIRQFIM